MELECEENAVVSEEDTIAYNDLLHRNMERKKMQSLHPNAVQKEPAPVVNYKSNEEKEM